MQTLRNFGRILFAIGIADFGIQYLRYGRFVGGLPPVPPWTPGGSIGSYLVGIFLVIAALAIAAKWKPRLLSILLGSFFFLCVLCLHLLHFSDVLTNGIDRTRALEPLAIAALAFVLAGTFPMDPAKYSPWDNAMQFPIRAARFVFAFTMVIFGMQHFQFAPFIASLIPAWIPGHSFWAWFTGFAFIGAAVSISLNILGRLAATLLGLMFFLWVLVLHGPRAIAALSNGDEWASLFVALALAGGSFVLSTTLRNQP